MLKKFVSNILVASVSAALTVSLVGAIPASANTQPEPTRKDLCLLATMQSSAATMAT